MISCPSPIPHSFTRGCLSDCGAFFGHHCCTRGCCQPDLAGDSCMHQPAHDNALLQCFLFGVHPQLSLPWVELGRAMIKSCTNGVPIATLFSAMQAGRGKIRVFRC